MLLTITTTYQPATDLGYLLHKHPDRVQSFPLSFGQAHVFYPEAAAERCTAALLLDVDPVRLVRKQGGGFALAQYVNDRPYVASSFLSVAIAQVYSSALAGKSAERSELAEMALPLEAKISVLPCRSGENLLVRLFGPLGYTITTQSYPLDETFPGWGTSSYYTVTLAATCRLTDLLAHLYVLVPVLDNDKHYYVGDEEIDKLLRHGEGWLITHPEREFIARRYLRYQTSLTREALARLADANQPDPDRVEVQHDQEEAGVEAQISLNELRLGAVMAALKDSGARRVLDLGCGEGNLLWLLWQDQSFTEIIGLDVSQRALAVAAERLQLDRLPPKQQQRIQLIQGSLMYRDPRLKGYEAAAVVEVIEHLDPARLAAFEHVLFEFARPVTVIITTPNVEYNVRWASLPAGQFRHKDHRFEWTRAEFQAWAQNIAERFNYRVRIVPVGPEDPEVGSPSQMAIFSRGETWHRSERG